MKGKKKNLAGLRKALRYGYVPCKLGLCGPNDKKKFKIIDDFLRGNMKLADKAEKILREFRGAFPYYQLIAKVNKISDPLDKKVVEAYWLGNSLLENIKGKNLKDMMKTKFLPLGHMPREKIEKISDKSLAYHNFHVMSIGSVTGTLKETKKALDLCRVSWGKVSKVEKSEIITEWQPLKFGNKKTLGIFVKKAVRWNKNLLPAIKKGDWISIHWNTAIEKLNNSQLKNLRKYTKKVLTN
jgi:hypothetical protein